jgi:hypothetical protein
MAIVSVEEAWNRVAELVRERPEWLPVLRAACKVAEESEPYGGRFAGRWVLQEAGHWAPGLRVLASYGLLEKSGQSTRQGRRAYYRMPDWRDVRQALSRLDTTGLAVAGLRPLPAGPRATSADYEKEMRSRLQEAAERQAFELVPLTQAERTSFVEALLQVCAARGWQPPAGEPQLSVRNPADVGSMVWEWRPTGGSAYVISSKDQLGLMNLARSYYQIASELRDTPLGRNFRDHHKPKISAPGLL